MKSSEGAVSDGGFTIPGESSYEELTLDLARRWKADVIRDSDGTELSPELLKTGMEVYSTICIIRDHNEYALQHPGFQQQTILESRPSIARSRSLEIDLLSGYSREQFSVNTSAESVRLWQVFDRTAGKELPASSWSYDEASGKLSIDGTVPYHVYSADFFAWRIWEEISMYNHVTNGWTKEHLMQLDPRYPEVRRYLCDWLDKWCISHPHTSVVRFTSLFYNFVWIWGDDSRRQDIFTDWGSYDFSVSPRAFDDFKAEVGYPLECEDFINQGRRNPNHMTHSRKIRDYIDFTCRFVSSFAKDLVGIVHSYGKKAYVFYDDSWIGLEPNGRYFQSIGFDGLIKCVFSGFEARLCAACESVDVHELRLHPYLFPTGLGGAPTFSEGGHPEEDAMLYWSRVRRAILRKPVDRIGLGGYLHLTEGYPEFVDAVEQIADEFRTIRDLHRESDVLSYDKKVLVLTEWGRMRAWTCGGHYHEHPDLDLINILEALSGMPVNVSFCSFDELPSALDGCDVLISAGTEHSAWSGGEAWADAGIIECISSWVDRGGAFIAAGQATMLRGYSTLLRMSHVLGVDLLDDRRLCEGRWDVQGREGFPAVIQALEHVVLTDPETEILSSDGIWPAVTRHGFGKGYGIYAASFRYSPEAAAALRGLMGLDGSESGNPCVDIAVFPASGKAVAASQSGKEEVFSFNGRSMTIKPYGFEVIPF